MSACAQTGRRGEDAAARYLVRQGYTLLARNYRVREGEIDIIARKGGFLALVEVKTRANSRFGQAREAVTPRKQARISAAAAQWLAAHPCALQPRFDVVEVYWSQGAPVPRAIRYFENAFETGEGTGL